MKTSSPERKKRVAVIGATGSVGTAALDVCRAYPELLEVRALAAHSSAERMIRLSAEFNNAKLCLTSDRSAETLRRALPDSVAVIAGTSGLKEIAEDPEIDHIVFASSGTAAIEALQAALSADKEISLANKESIVVAGAWVMPLVQRPDQLRPLDSEHNAIWQCFQGESAHEKRGIRKIYLTASGGPFRDRSLVEMERVTPEMALNHPVWNMGAKITVDSATLMNKGIELIEAMLLFGLQPEQVEALVSPGSFVHGLIEFEDGCVKMLAGEPDMRLPASSCLFWPERRLPFPAFPRPQLDARRISFDSPDEVRFPALKLAKLAMTKGGAYPTLLVGADEVAVDRFLNKVIPFTAIAESVEETMGSYKGDPPRSLEEAFSVLEWARGRCAEICNTKR